MHFWTFFSVYFSDISSIPPSLVFLFHFLSFSKSRLGYFSIHNISFGKCVCGRGGGGDSTCLWKILFFTSFYLNFFSSIFPPMHLPVFAECPAGRRGCRPQFRRAHWTLAPRAPKSELVKTSSTYQCFGSAFLFADPWIRIWIRIFSMRIRNIGLYSIEYHTFTYLYVWYLISTYMIYCT